MEEDAPKKLGRGALLLKALEKTRPPLQATPTASPEAVVPSLTVSDLSVWVKRTIWHSKFL